MSNTNMETKAIQKGEFGGECNRQACSTTPAVYFNFSTRKHYCRACAQLINDANRADAMRIFGHELCLPKTQVL